MRVTKITVHHTRGANKRPSAGDVVFSDGKEYRWSTSSCERAYLLTSDTQRNGSWYRRSAVASPKRAAAMDAALHSN
jgi:hypothetical protein